MRILMLWLTLVLAGCIAEKKDDVVLDEQGQQVPLPTLSLNGFWDGGFNQADDLRVLVYNGNVYGRNATHGFYGSVQLDNDYRRASMTLEALTLNVGSSTTNRQWIADGANSDYDIALQLYTLVARNDSMQGTAEINGADAQLTDLLRDGTWNTNSPLTKLVKSGVWESGNVRLVTNTAVNGVSFQGNSTTTPTCSFDGLLRLLDVRQNLYAVTMNPRSNCAAFNGVASTGYAGFNSDGDLEFYLRSSGNELLFMSFTPPVSATPAPAPAPVP